MPRSLRPTPASTPSESGIAVGAAPHSGQGAAGDEIVIVWRSYGKKLSGRNVAVFSPATFRKAIDDLQVVFENEHAPQPYAIGRIELEIMKQAALLLDDAEEHYV